MKKYFIILLLFACSYSYGQTITTSNGNFNKLKFNLLYSGADSVIYRDADSTRQFHYKNVVDPVYPTDAVNLRTLQGFSSGHDSTFFNIENGYWIGLNDGVRVDSISFDGRYKLKTDSTDQYVYDQIEVGGTSAVVTYPFIFDTINYRLDLYAYTIETNGGKTYEVSNPIYNTVKTVSGFTCSVLNSGGYLRYSAYDTLTVYATAPFPDAILRDQTVKQTIVNGVPELESTRTISGNNDLVDVAYVDSSINSMAMGGVKSWYFTKDASDVVGMYKAIPTITTGTKQAITASVGVETVVATFIADSLAHRVVDGNRFFHFDAKVSNAAKNPQLRGEVWTTDLLGANPILLRTSNYTIPLTEVEAEYQTSAYGGTLDIPDTIRIMFKIVAIREAGGANPTVTIYVDDNTFSRLDVPVATISIGEIVSQTITNGETGKAPSEDAVFDALAAKQNKLTNPVTSPNNGVFGYFPHYTGATTIDNSGVYWDAVNSRVGINTTTPTHSITLPRFSTMAFYNTSDQTTNYERVEQLWSGNFFLINSRGAGTGTARTFTFSINGGQILNINNQSSTGSVTFPSNFSAGDGNPYATAGFTGTFSNTGVSTSLAILNTINQGSTSGGYRCLWISPYEQSLGSGITRLVDVGTNSNTLGSGTHTSKFIINGSGNVGINTTAPDVKVEVNQPTAGTAIQISLNDANGGATDKFMLGIGATGNGLLSVATGDTIKIQNVMSYIGTYAGIYVADASTAQAIATGTTYTKSTAFTTNGSSSNCTADVANDKITFTKKGKYLVNCPVSFSGASPSVNWKMAAFWNNTEQAQIHVQRKIGTGGDVGSATITGIVNVASVPTDLDVRFRHDQGGSENITVVYSNLTATYIGE